MSCPGRYPLNERRRGVFRRVVSSALLFEAGAALLFFGVLATMPGLHEAGDRALRDLAALGYRVPDATEPVRVYPAGLETGFDAHHAGGWRRGVISLRVNPAGAAGPETYLRHELMHEAGTRTCGGRLPLWAEEAAAIRFSGEAAMFDGSEAPSEGDLRHLAERVRIGAPPDTVSHGALVRLVAIHGWPDEPCRVSPVIERILAAEGDTVIRGGGNFSCLFASLVSGRVLEFEGDRDSVYPPGSLLKLVYAAALRDVEPEAVGRELARSDTGALLARFGSLDGDRYRLLISAAGDSALLRSLPPSPGVPPGEASKARRLLGERDGDGFFPLEADLPALARMVRAAFLMAPDRFKGLARNGVDTGTTLAATPEGPRRALRRLHALAKTGTASDGRGVPLVGHLAVAWPEESPVYLALFRTVGGNGASNLERASTKLDEWARRYPGEFGKVRVALMTLLSPELWEILDESPAFDVRSGNGESARVSLGGSFRVIASARGARSERFVSGILKHRPGRDGVVLETDVETYADAVLSAEAADLPREAAAALRAVVAWNGVRGFWRHPESGGVCDSTHCMVFRGSLRGEDEVSGPATDAELMRYLDDLAAKKGLEWLPFSAGGVDRWVRNISGNELHRALSEASILDVRRERTRGGEVEIHLFYRESEETVSCEVFRNRMRLPSCPESIRRDEAADAWIFEGMGRGHGMGLSVERARGLSEAGFSARDILGDAYR